VPKGDQCANQFAQRITLTRGNEFKPFPQETRRLRLRQSEVKHSQRGVKLFIEVFRHPIFLNTKADMPAMKLQIRFNDPMMAVVAFALKKKCVRPRAPFFLAMNVTFGAANGFVYQGIAA
jgi:hypothetical protein